MGLYRTLYCFNHFSMKTHLAYINIFCESLELINIYFSMFQKIFILTIITIAVTLYIPHSNQHFFVRPMAQHYTHAQSFIRCSKDKPKYNDLQQQCEACQAGFTYYKDTDECQKDIVCGPTQTFNRSQKRCVQTSSLCRVSEVYVIKINKCLSKSITCNQHQFYSSEAQTCITIQSICTKDELYEKSTHKCISKKSQCIGNENYNEELRICQKMILCESDQMLNYKLNICEKKALKCNPSTQYFNRQLEQCVDFQFSTSPYSPNLILSDGLQSYLTYYKQQKALFGQTLKDCPLKAPYFQISAKKCASCPEQAPYFNLDADNCSNCPQKSAYNPIKHICSPIKDKNIPKTINRIGL